MKIGDEVVDGKGRKYKLVAGTKPLSITTVSMIGPLTSAAFNRVGDSVNVPLTPRRPGMPIGNMQFERIA